MKKFKKVPVRRVGPPGIISGREFTFASNFKSQNWYVHESGTLRVLRSGLVCLRHDSELVTLSSGMMAYLPPGVPHYEIAMNIKSHGWILTIPHEKVKALGHKLSVFQVTNLFSGLCEKVVSFGATSDSRKTPEQKRILMTFVDELLSATPVHCSHVSLPRSPRICKVTRRILDDPSDKRNIDHWAEVAGMSRRSFTKHFNDETGLSFAVWRQRVKLHKALKLLSAGNTVAETSQQLGFHAPSALVELFRRYFGIAPGHFIQRERHLHEELSLNASPTIHPKNVSKELRVRQSVILPEC